MKIGETEILREEGDVRLLKIGCRGDREVFCVIWDGSTQHYDYYEDALNEFNLRWMKAMFSNWIQRKEFYDEYWMPYYKCKEHRLGR